MISRASLDLASRLVFQDVRDYLKARGWTSSTSRRSYAAIYRSPLGGETEVLVPLDRGLGDYAEAMRRVAEQVGNFEGRDSNQVLRDLLHPRCDTLRFALEGATQTAGVVPLLDGASLISGVRKALLASACGAQRPRKYHPRMSFVDAEAYVQACTLGQTEVGSFVLTVDAPLETTSQPIQPGSFGRRASEYLLTATSLLADSIRKDDLTPILDVPDEGARVSANLCNAVLEMLPSDESADLRLRGSWSPLLPSTSAPELVSIDRGMYGAIEDIGNRLRPSAGPKADVFVGPVLELLGTPGQSGAVEGEVTLLVFHDGDLLKARATLGPEDYKVAGAAHFASQFVTLRAVLHRGHRLNQLRELTDFKFLES